MSPLAGNAVIGGLRVSVAGYQKIVDAPGRTLPPLHANSPVLKWWLASVTAMRLTVNFTGIRPALNNSIPNLTDASVSNWFGGDVVLCLKSRTPRIGICSSASVFAAVAA